MQSFKIRQANEDDAEAIGVAHRRSILDLAVKDYPTEIISEWGQIPTPDAVQRFKDAIRLGKEIVWVAEISGTIEGFASMVLERNEIRAVYVTGSASRKGVGQALLIALEDKAIELEIQKLGLRSSISAKSFYEKNGYKNLGKSFHKLRSGHEMDCFIMEKILLV